MCICIRCLKMGRWDELNEFAMSLNIDILWGINGLSGRQYIGNCTADTDCVNNMPHPSCCYNWTGAWDSSMASDFFEYTANKGNHI